MPGYRIPGPACQVRDWVDIDDGTSALAAMPVTVPVGARVPIDPPNDRWKYVLVGPVSVDTGDFFEEYQHQFGPPNAKTKSAITALLEFIANDHDIHDVRWVAYILATVKRETANTFLPIREYGKGSSHKDFYNRKTKKLEKGKGYGSPVKVKCGGKEVEKTYYGRGYVQLTWEETYAALGKKFGKDLICNPDLLVEDAAFSYRVMSYCMRTGEFFANGHKFGDYFNATLTDYVNARRMVNGTDHCDQIAAWAEKFEKILFSSLILSGTLPDSTGTYYA